MNTLRFIIFALSLTLFTACDNGDGIDLVDPENLKQYPIEIFFENRIIPDSVTVSIYIDNRIINEVKADNMCHSGAKCWFITEPIKFGDYAKVTLYAHAVTENDTTKMIFYRYAPMTESNSWMGGNCQRTILNIYTATASKAIEYFLQRKNMSFKEATAKAYENMKDFGFTDRDFEKDEFRPKVSSINPIQLPYTYCRYFLSDSVFYSDFLELQDAIRDAEWGDTLFRVRAADALVSSFKNMNWINVPGMSFYGYEEYIPNFWETIYGMEVCDDRNYGETFINRNRRSTYYDSVFVCDSRLKQGYYKWKHWRLRTPLESELGLCLPKESVPGEINPIETKISEKDSTVYTCGLDGWEKITDKR